MAGVTYFFQQNTGAEVTQTRQMHSQKLRATRDSNSNCWGLAVDSALEGLLPVFLIANVKCTETEQPAQGHRVTDLDLTQTSSSIPHTALHCVPVMVQTGHQETVLCSKWKKAEPNLWQKGGEIGKGVIPQTDET